MKIITRILILTLSLFMFVGCAHNNYQQRTVINLKKDWKFSKTDVANADQKNFDDSNWESVQVPHDWAIYGPFDKNNDAYETVVVENGERIPSLKTGRTGGLPHIGVGWYRRTIDIPKEAKSKKIFIEFDGAMSHSKVYLNGNYIGEWPYGYSSFSFELTEFIKFGEENILAVRLENYAKMSRWYPGAGLYRNVRLLFKSPTHIAQWGTYITTPKIQNANGLVNIKTTICGNEEVELLTEIYSPVGKLVKSKSDRILVNDKTELSQDITVDQPLLWNIDQPNRYTVVSKIIKNNQVIDSYNSSFGFRYFKFTADDGFYLNGKRVQIQGVCMHHDLGPIGTAVNNSAIVRQLRILKEMGCNAIRTSHNMPSPEYLHMCDSMGFVVMDEAFDEWKNVKVVNGYNKLWDEWREKDLTNFIQRDRNHPSVVLWSVGNEISEQYGEETWKIAKSLVDICHKEDSTRPVSIGLNTYSPVTNNFAAQFDVKGWNYALDYAKVHEEKPDWAILASETQSTVSSRGYYDTNAIPRAHYERNNLQCSAYGLEYPSWANTPDVGFATLDDHPFIAGEFVWTGFDYLGEPTPYDSNWPSRSSYFGIVDLAGIPKDLFYMYQERWTDKEVLHILPHWNWEKGQNIPVHVFSNYNSAELFVNGKSYGVKTKDATSVYNRYRLVWDSVSYEPGIVKVIALDEYGKACKEAQIETAGEPHAIKIISDTVDVKANGEDLAFFEVQIIDKAGIVCPLADNLIHFEVEGNATFRAASNGDATDLEPFHTSNSKCFYGKCVAVIKTTEKAGSIKLKASSGNLIGAEAKIVSRKK